MIIPKNWELKKMTQVVLWSSGGTPRATEKLYYENGTIPWLVIGDLNDGVVNCAASHITELGLKNSSAKMMPAGTLLVAMYGSIGKLGITGMPCCTNQAIAFAKELYGVTTKYMFYYLSMIKPQLLTKGKGGTQKNISLTVLNSIDVVVPPIEEQARIVARIEELFSELDAGVETLQKIKQQLSVYRRSVLKDAFMPKDNWRKVEAGEIGQVCLGRQRSPQNVSANYPTKYIRAANITEKGIDTSDILEMEFTPTEREKYYLKYNDIVVSEASGSKTQVGKPALWKNEIDKCCFQNTVIRHRITSDNPSFVYWQYKYHYLNGGFAKMVGGVGINHIGAKNFSQIELWLAPLDQQKEIVERIEEQLSLCEAIEATIETALQEAYAMRQSILKQAFEGGL
jgi:type I restriction enzyme S subunit